MTSRRDCRARSHGRKCGWFAFDPPYWKQAEGRYSDDRTDLANMPLEQFHEVLCHTINDFGGPQPWGSGKNWFARHREDFRQVLGIDWNEFGDQNISILEHINLARNDIFHNPEISTLLTHQSSQHFMKYTESFFADELHLEIAKAQETGTPDRRHMGFGCAAREDASSDRPSRSLWQVSGGQVASLARMIRIAGRTRRVFSFFLARRLPFPHAPSNITHIAASSATL